ncbi:hypothetical protein CHU92_08495 [Flavobacterium cyanobacteriorum]|uniref:Ig-like domain-containing protein n=1 Tax=Flavobacterium cyanobacteriorum TaxID=2022802 RepID=A0A255Z8U3_9FLAO|nr:choice-of-anchor L domain-containing protein [Flavobacterium cyanobacteriorum]OYQ37324.1 hypothetical protein CHU92_08495 [Flavobacterium cyanobacteriorum]
MIRHSVYLHLLIALICSPRISAQFIQVDDNYTPQQLVDALVSGSCAQVSNVSASGWAGGSGGPSFGYFTAGSSAFPFSNGIVLSTGFAASAPGPNSSLLSQGGSGWGGDSDLEVALGVSGTTNATILEFDFVPLTNRISFDYIFASEQYLTSINSPNQCNFTDGFAFLLKPAGSSGPYQNLALIPGTNIPVRVNTVRGAGVCPPANEAYFGGFNPNNSPVNFNGQTVILTAEADVVAGTAYHIKLVVADQGNGLYDSAIFLGGGSFNATTDLGPDRLEALGNALCNGETLALDATNPAATNYLWYRNGVLQPSASGNPVYNVTQPGTYRVEVELNGSCFSRGETVVEYLQPIAATTATLLQCDTNSDGIATFNLLLANDLINNNPQLAVSYYTSLTAANAGQQGTGFISNPGTFTNTTPNQQVYARVESQFGCFGVSTVTLSTSNNTVSSTMLSACDDDGADDGFYSFDLTDAQTAILQNLPPGLQLRYFTSAADALLITNQITSPASFTNTIPTSQVVYARISGGSDCYGIATINLMVNTFGEAIEDETITLCAGTTISLNPGNYNTYEWDVTPTVNTPTLTVSQPGVYKVTLTNTTGCEGTKTYTVVGSGPATGADITINDFAGNNNSIAIVPDGVGDYEFSLDGITYQPDPFFSNLSSGEYPVHIKDVNGCGPVYIQIIYVLDYPRFFTPNGDGVNDYWRIPFLQGQPDAEVAVFDRFGKLIQQFNGSSRGWNGTFNGSPLPSTDYWFVLKFGNGRTIKGHFAMLR